MKQQNSEVFKQQLKMFSLLKIQFLTGSKQFKLGFNSCHKYLGFEIEILLEIKTKDHFNLSRLLKLYSQTV